MHHGHAIGRAKGIALRILFVRVCVRIALLHRLLLSFHRTERRMDAPSLLRVPENSGRPCRIADRLRGIYRLDWLPEEDDKKLIIRRDTMIRLRIAIGLVIVCPMVALLVSTPVRAAEGQK